MFALTFRFSAGRYHATPWGRNVNEAGVAWPPEPWRLLRTLIAVWWRKGNRERWSEDDLARLIDQLAEAPPVYRLPKGAIHSHTRHYMPQKKGNQPPKLIRDAFVHLPRDTSVVVAWPDVTLNSDLFELAIDLATSIGYLGRAESWTECQAIDQWDGEANCRVAKPSDTGTPVRVLAPLSPAKYATERTRLREPASRNLSRKNVDTLPARLLDALMLDTADYQTQGWSRPPAAQEVLYTCAAETAPAVVSQNFSRRRRATQSENMPTVARFLLAGRPLPRIEDSVRIGELMRLAALAKFGWSKDEATGRSIPNAPWQISGRGLNGRPLLDPVHNHAFWLPEDADSDGWIDHISVYIPSGINDDIRARLDRINRLWLAPKQRPGSEGWTPSAVKEWRLALEGFGNPNDFAGSAPVFSTSTHWESVTPFMSAGHLKASGYRGELIRLLKRRGFNTENVGVEILKEISVGGTVRRATHFHRFRSRGGEKQPDTQGILMRITFPEPITGPLAIGFGSHFGLGLFVGVNDIKL